MARRKRRRTTKKFGYIRCGICGTRVRYQRGYIKKNGVEAGRIRAIRKHWSKSHPSAFRQSIMRGVAKRMRRRARVKRLR